MSDFDLRWEELEEGKALLHCNVHRWAPSVARALDLAVGEVFNELFDKGYTEAFTLSSNNRFCAYMGGTPIGVVTYNLIDHWIYTWELE